ncbi:MAG: protoporphyrinogen oxidase, partial [Chloroflexota bacterium]
ALCRELGLGDDVTPPLEPGGTFVWHDDRLVPVPDGIGLGIPTRFTPFLASRLFSPLAKLRAAIEIVIPPDPSAGDVSIGAFLRRRFGGAVVDRLAGPLISGVYGAAIDELSLDALMPRLREAEQRYRSLVRAGLAARGRGPAGPLLVTLRRGMGSLIDALAARLARVDMRLGVDLRWVERAGPGYATHLGDGSRVVADAVVLATPAPAAARALADLAPAAADALATITYRGTAAVSLAYDARQLAGPLSGHGFVVPDGALAIAACTWSSAKWPERAPQDTVLVRATVRSDALLAQGDDALVDAAHGALVRAMRIQGRPVLARVARWDGAMPRYTVGHLDRLARIGAALLPFPGIVLAGAAYRGAGVPDCIAQGQAAAETILAAEAVGT